MNSKTVYFIRHAESTGNSGDIQLGSEAQLTARGIEQAKLLGKRLKNEKISIILFSPFDRCQDTAKFVNSYHNADIRLYDCLQERRRPSIVYGMKKNNPKRRRINQEIYENFGVRDWRYSDEENFTLLNLRAQKVIDLINNVEGQKVVCFSHGYIMRVVIAKILFESNLTGDTCKEFVRTMHFQNTGITEVRQSTDNRWFVWRWNDHAHLDV